LVGAELQDTRIPKPRHDGDALTTAQIIVAIVGVLALTVVCFLVLLISGPLVLPDLDLDAYVFNPAQRVYYWAFLCALGFGLTAAAVLLAIVDHRCMSRSSPMRRTISGLKNLLRLLALVSLPAFLAWAVAFSRHEPAVRSRCINNLKSIAIAMKYYHDDFGCLPPALIPDEKGRPKHSWRLLILPYLEKTGVADRGELKHLYESYDFSEPWDGLNNRKLVHRMPLVYDCRNDPGRRVSTTWYLVIIGEHSAFPGSRLVKLDDIRDEKSSTILGVETRNSGINWMEPKDYPIEELRFGPREALERQIGGNHLGGAYARFADRSVRFLTESEFGSENLKSLATIDGREKLDPLPR